MKALEVKRAIFPLLVVATGFGVFLVTSCGFLPAKADSGRVVLKDGDLFTISETVGEKRLTTDKNIKFMFERKDGKILFGSGMNAENAESEGTFGTELWMFDEKTGTKKILNSGLETNGAILSSNGSKVYFTTRGRDLFIENTDGSGKQKLQEKVLSPVLSKDGTKMIYQKLPSKWSEGDYFDEALGLTVLDLASNKEVRVGSNAGDWAPLFAPNGKKIIFSSANEFGISSFFSMNVDGSARTGLSNLKQVTVTDATLPSPSERPVFSDDGSRFVYESDRAIWAVQFNADYTQILSSKKIGYGTDPRWVGKSRVSFVAAPGAKGKGIFEVEL